MRELITARVGSYPCPSLFLSLFFSLSRLQWWDYAVGQPSPATDSYAIGHPSLQNCEQNKCHVFINYSVCVITIRNELRQGRRPEMKKPGVSFNNWRIDWGLYTKAEDWCCKRRNTT
jgi:hypothetical protein